MFYAQSTIAVESKQAKQRKRVTDGSETQSINFFIFVENALVIKLPKRFRVQGLDWSLIVKPGGLKHSGNRRVTRLRLGLRLQ